MTRGRIFTRAIPLLVGIGLFLSGCAVRPVGYYDGFYYGGWGGWHHGWDHSHWDHGGWGHGFAHHGFGGHGGGGGDNGGGDPLQIRKEHPSNPPTHQNPIPAFS